MSGVVDSRPSCGRCSCSRRSPTSSSPGSPGRVGVQRVPGRRRRSSPRASRPSSFFVLLSGTIALTRRVGQDDVETVRTDQRGVYMGATQAYLRDDDAPRQYTATDAGDQRLPVLRAAGGRLRPDDARVVPDGDPPARGPVLRRCATRRRVIGERQRLTALGSLTAGLMHELNNPAAAAVAGHRRAAPAGRRHAAQARHARRRPDRPGASCTRSSSCRSRSSSGPPRRRR